ncbi:MAG: RnfABCDGE type electron transport complex subunit B [Oscillospiraceae bacterium]|jgi:Na+-translocating ferredoxin:NAD+ oxidoreductase RNF subunit RnfB|nr:RnfABCDGE type electron transport complex subunit B [Oscillospiraceae bacterium]
MDILLPIIVVGSVALILGVGLVFASEKFAVPTDEREEEMLAALPGVNCGACGYSGCAGYAAALYKGEIKSASLCAPGGDEVAAQITKLTGLAPEHIVPMTALVRCQGGDGIAKYSFLYSGMQSCRMAAQLAGGVKTCPCGCIGLGDCATVCPYDAVRVCPDGVARVDTIKCRACKACVVACPKDLITLVPKEAPPTAVLCRNTQKGAVTRKLCEKGCIGCMRCKKTCLNDAVILENNLARINPEKCTGCGECVKVCPVACIV